MTKGITVQELRKQNYRVRVKHHRMLNVPINSPKGASDPIDDCVTEYEYEQAKLEGRVVLADFLRMQWGNNILPHGGFTTVEVTRPDGVELKGRYNFAKTRQYNRKIGVMAALGRALAGQK